MYLLAIPDAANEGNSLAIGRIPAVLSLMDFAANENLKFRFGMRVDDDTWGHGTLTAANPQPAVQPYLAYLQFKWPDTDIEITAGYQPVSVPHSEAFYDSIVLAADDGDQSSAALFVKLPLIEDKLALEAAFARLIAAYQTFEATTTQVDGNFDIYRLAVPVTVEGFEVTPWGLAGVYGKATDPDGLFDTGLRAGGSYLTNVRYRYNQNALWWTGVAANISALDPVNIYFDAIYGDAGSGDRSRNRRHGYFFDAAVTYTGFDWAVPGIYGWLASGEDASLANGSERLPVIAPKWGAATSFLFDCDQDFSNNSMEEVTGPVIAIVLVLCAVFVPVAFLGGLTGQMYKQFAITIAVSVVISGLVALTLTPALCALLLHRVQAAPNRAFAAFNRLFETVTDGYGFCVRFLLTHTVLAMIEETQSVELAVQQSFLAHSLKRICDQCANIAESAIFIHQGIDYKHKGKQTPPEV